MNPDWEKRMFRALIWLEGGLWLYGQHISNVVSQSLGWIGGE